MAQCPTCQKEMAPAAAEIGVCNLCGASVQNPSETTTEAATLPGPATPPAEPAVVTGQSSELVEADKPLEFTSMDNYDITGEIGQGEHGTLYKAHHTRDENTVALKVVGKGVEISPEEEEDYFRSAQTASRLEHPQVIKRHDFGHTKEGEYWFTLDYIDGDTLFKRISEKGPLPVDEANRIAGDLARIMDAAHQHNYVHQNIAPENILLDKEGKAYLRKFGFSVEAREEGAYRISADGRVAGLLPYMAPEMARNQSSVVGKVSDIYSLGAVYYFMLTGKPPFQSPNKEQLQLCIEHNNPPRPSKEREEATSRHDTIILRCLDKVRQGRYQSAAELADDIDALCSGKETSPPRISIKEKFARFMEKHETGVRRAALAVLLLFLFGLPVYLILKYPPPKVELPPKQEQPGR